MLHFNNIPNFTSLAANNSAYFADSEYIQSMQSILNNKHKDFLSRIKVQPLTFIESMINSISSLYSEDFTRVLKNDSQLDNKSLKVNEVYLERFYQLHKRAATYLSTDKDNKVKFTALDPTRYFVQGQYSFMSKDDNNTVLYIEQENTLDIYDIALAIDKAVNDYDLEKEPLEQYKSEENSNIVVVKREREMNGITKSPIVEITTFNNKKAYLSSLVILQEAFISDISWGIYAGSIKLISQMVLESSTDPEKTKAMLANLGSVNQVVQVGKGNKLDMIIPGDVKVLLDLFDMYTEILKQIAVQQGADITAVIPSEESGSESAAAKMVKLNYINKARKNHTMIFEQHEQELWDRLKEGFNIDVGYDSISFPDLKVNETEQEKLTYNENLYKIGLINFQQLYANVFNVSYEKAATEIKLYGLTPEDLGIDDDGLEGEGSEVDEVTE